MFSLLAKTNMLHNYCGKCQTKYYEHETCNCKKNIVEQIGKKTAEKLAEEVDLKYIKQFIKTFIKRYGYKPKI